MSPSLRRGEVRAQPIVEDAVEDEVHARLPAAVADAVRQVEVEIPALAFCEDEPSARKVELDRRVGAHGDVYAHLAVLVAEVEVFVLAYDGAGVEPQQADGLQ